MAIAEGLSCEQEVDVNGMSPLWKKMNLKDQPTIVVLNAPESFEAELTLTGGAKVVRDVSKVKLVEFAVAFVVKQAELDAAAKALAEKADGDAILWFAYPKGTSKRYKCEFNRDSGWGELERVGFETVRAVAIDEDWTGLRFRHGEFVKSRRVSGKGSRPGGGSHE